MHRFSKWHPAVLLLFFLFVILLSCLSANPIYVLISFAGALCCQFCADGEGRLKVLFWAVPLVIVVGIFNFIFTHWGETVLFTAGETAFTLESLIYGLYQGMIFASVMMWLRLFGKTVSSEKLLAAAGKAAPSLSLFFSMTLGMIGRFQKDARKIKEAAMGLPDNGAKPFQKALSQFSTLVTLSLEGSMTTADAMRARGYGKGRRKTYDRFSFTPVDAVLTAAVILLFGVTAFVVISGGAQFIFDPYIELVTFNPLGVICAALLFFCPIITDFSENLKWLLLKQKN